MTILEFLADYGSTTRHFKKMSDKYHLEVLNHQAVDGYFTRLVIIYVDDLPVMFGLSETKLSNPQFLDILQNAGVIPIGVKLFAPNTPIVRTKMNIRKIRVSTIKNAIVSEYLIKNNVSGQIYYRESSFVNGSETMQLKEYILPGLLELLARAGSGIAK